jgi:hypothetical protein
MLADLTPSDLRSKILLLTSVIEDAHFMGLHPIEVSIQRAVRDIYRRQLIKILYPLD